MSLSRIEAGRFVTPGERVSIGKIVVSAVENARRIPAAAGCGIFLQVQDPLPDILGDHAQLMQLIDNLLSNAIRYGCDAQNCAVRVAANADGGVVRITVGDNGPGIPRDHLRRVTERFYRVDEARSRESGGTGLGLAIVKHIVERHKGTLDIRSTVGEGTEVTVVLPIAQ
jgi:two-component system phosphate regulon sensor histidine kinase PhoR